MGLGPSFPPGLQETYTQLLHPDIGRGEPYPPLNPKHLCLPSCNPSSEAGFRWHIKTPKCAHLDAGLWRERCLQCHQMSIFRPPKTIWVSALPWQPAGSPSDLPLRHGSCASAGNEPHHVYPNCITAHPTSMLPAPGVGTSPIAPRGLPRLTSQGKQTPQV